MDGTLVDSTPVVEQGWANWAEKYDLSLKSVLAFSHGRPARATMEHFFPAKDHTVDLEALAAHEESTLEGISAIPGAELFVKKLSGFPWAIVTSAWRKLALARITSAGLPIPDVLVPVDEIEKGKPDPEGFLKAAALLNIPPQECLVFEDTRPGIDAALRAGMSVVGLLTTTGREQLNHSLLVEDFRSVSLVPQNNHLSVTITLAR